jgi:hypothetical protein
MSFSHEFKFLNDKNTIIVKYIGEVDFIALMEISRALYDHPGYSPQMNGIFDFTQCRLNLDFDDLFAFVKFLASSEQRIRGLCAFVTQTTANYGTTRMYTELGEELQGEIKYFENIEDAMQWIEKTNRSEPGSPGTSR